MLAQSSVAPLTLHVGAEHAAAPTTSQASKTADNGFFVIDLERKRRFLLIFC